MRACSCNLERYAWLRLGRAVSGFDEMLTAIPISYGFIVGGLGLALFTIGGFIQLANNPNKINEDWDRIAKGFRNNPLGYNRAGVDILDPKVRWWCIPGMIGVLAGLAIVALR